jgi:hypothetical protein
MQGVLHYSPHDVHDCWYHDFISQQRYQLLMISFMHYYNMSHVFIYLRRCKDDFDFSDHIVFTMIHYMLPLAMESAVIYNRIYTQSGSFMTCLMQYSLSALVIAVLVMLSCRSLLLTAMFFHTNVECLVAIGVAVVCGVLPIYLLDGSSYWSACLHRPKNQRHKS